MVHDADTEGEPPGPTWAPLNWSAVSLDHKVMMRLKLAWKFIPDLKFYHFFKNVIEA